MHDEQFNDVFRSGGGGTGERKEKERVVKDIRNRSSQSGPDTDNMRVTYKNTKKTRTENIVD